MLTDFLKKLGPKQAAPQPRPVAPYRFGYTLEYFRSSSQRVDAMKELLRSPLFQAAMSVLQHEIPLDDINAVRGHRQCMRLIELMAESPTQSNTELESTFGAPPEETTNPQETNQ